MTGRFLTSGADLLRIDFLLHRGVVARPRHRRWVDQIVEFRDRRGRQANLFGAGVFFEVIQARRAGNWNDVLPSSKDPREGRLRHRAALLASDRRQAVAQGEVLREVLFLKARHPEPDVLRREGRGIDWLTTQEAACDRAERHERNAKLAASVENRDFSVAGPQ